MSGIKIREHKPIKRDVFLASMVSFFIKAVVILDTSPSAVESLKTLLFDSGKSPINALKRVTSVGRSFFVFIIWNDIPTVNMNPNKVVKIG
jgi:hypothetical protein